MSGHPRRSRQPSTVALLLAAVAVAFFVAPLIGLVQRAEWSSLGSDLSSNGATSALRLSLICSLSAAALSVLFGTPLAWMLARVELFNGSTRVTGVVRAFVRGVVLLPMVVPPVVGGVALLSAFSLRSPIGGWLHDVFGVQLTFSTVGAVLAETFVAMPFYVIAVEGALRGLDRRYEDAAAGLGASRGMVFRRVTLPLIAPSAMAGAVLAWARALGEFGATITFAGNIEGRTRTLPLAVYLALESDPGAAIALSLVLLAVSLAVLIGLRDRWFTRA